MSRLCVAVVGGGPAGLMAAEVLSGKGLAVDVYDAMPTVGRKFLLAGKGGLNLTHSEPFDKFVARYGARGAQIKPMLDVSQGGLDADGVRDWARGLGVETFVGSSGRVFPTDMKAAPLLRAWLHRLRHPANGAGVCFHMRARMTGLALGADGSPLLSIDSTDGVDGSRATVSKAYSSVVLALGGASWKRLGSDGAWQSLLGAHGVDLAPLVPSNCGFDVKPGWSAYFKERFAGQPLKTVAIHYQNAQGQVWAQRGEFVVTQTGVEGSLIYALSSWLREDIAQHGEAVFHLDLLPDFSLERVQQEIVHPRGSKSLSSHLKSRLGLSGLKTAILYECLPEGHMQQGLQLAKACKALPIRLSAARPIDEAISSAGGVRFEGLTEQLMLRVLPRVFCAGEMLDWEAPTGGYLLTACLASGRMAAQGVLKLLDLK